MICGLAIYEPGGRRLLYFPCETEPAYITRLAFRIGCGDEPPGESEALAEFLYDDDIDAVAVGRLEVRKTTHRQGEP